MLEEVRDKLGRVDAAEQRLQVLDTGLYDLLERVRVLENSEQTGVGGWGDLSDGGNSRVKVQVVLDPTAQLPETRGLPNPEPFCQCLQTPVQRPH